MPKICLSFFVNLPAIWSLIIACSLSVRRFIPNSDLRNWAISLPKPIKSFSTSGTLKQSFRSQYSSIDGGIADSNLNYYVSEEHPDWDFSWESCLSNFQVFSQMKLSYYYTFDTPLYNDARYRSYISSEGNCALFSIFSYLYNLPTVKSSSGFSFDFPGLLEGRTVSSKFSYFANKNDVFYGELVESPKYFTADDHVYSVFYDDENNENVTLLVGKREWCLSSYFPEFNGAVDNSIDLYWRVREECIEKGYHPETGFRMTTYGEEVIENVAEYYGEELDISYSDQPSDVVANIINGYPVVLAAVDSKSYGNHAMVITGYRRYFEDGNQDKPMYLWRVADGQLDNEMVWFDPTKSEEISFFVTDGANVEWPSC